ncbi:MAG: cyclic-di-AMP receptor [Chloroflexi bacterium]|nr:cyclic-di-AMP receptor [Chloroflexota bacterium]MCL5075631.1 cyclic-di-AMP receptor [Chloroflexota bacterium]
MKLVMAIVHEQDAHKVLDALVSKRYSATGIGSVGGFLRKKNTTVLVSVEAEEIENVIDIIREICRARTEVFYPPPPVLTTVEGYVPTPIEVKIGGAIIFVIDIEYFERV